MQFPQHGSESRDAGTAVILTTVLPKELAWTLKDRHRKPKSTNNEIVFNKNNSRTNRHINIGWKI